MNDKSPDTKTLDANQPDYSLLHNLGLTKNSIQIYQSLCQDGPASVQQLADRLQRQRTGMYRELTQLERNSFVTGLKTDQQPTFYYRVRVDEALERLADCHKQALLPLIKFQKN